VSILYLFMYFFFSFLCIRGLEQARPSSARPPAARPSAHHMWSMWYRDRSWLPPFPPPPASGRVSWPSLSASSHMRHDADSVEPSQQEQHGKMSEESERLRKELGCKYPPAGISKTANQISSVPFEWRCMGGLARPLPDASPHDLLHHVTME
jgi:hypothetical protein